MPSISFLPFLQTVPIATRILTATLVLSTLFAILIRGIVSQQPADAAKLSFGLGVRDDGLIPWGEMPYLVLVPGKSLMFPWTFLTAGWVEINVIEFFLSLIALPLSARYLERVWGPRELIKFSIIVIVGSNVIAFGLSWLEWFVLGRVLGLGGLGDGLLTAPIRGQSALQVGFLVAFTQLIPEHQIQLLGKIKIRVKALPGIYLLFSNIICLILGPQPYILVQFGFIVAWWYLRFFKWSENGEFRGDRSETFAFVNWMPPIARKPVGIIGNIIFGLAVKFKIVQGWDDQGSYAMLPGPGSSRAEAERRRALALKALDARVASAPAGAASTQAATATTASTTSAAAPEVATAEKAKTPMTEGVPVYKEGGEASKD